MKHFVMSIFDEKAAAFLPPFVMHREELGVRVFHDCLNADDHQFSKHPEDYTLFVVGIFDDAKGSISPESPRSLGNGVELRMSSAIPLEAVQ